jgi:hypothetical protein
MSDASQGPGWWLASDGKWYPPQPTVSPPPTPPVPPQASNPPLPMAPAPRRVSRAPGASRSPLVIVGGLVAMLGALLLVIGALLPWLTASHGHFTLPGVRGNGILTLLLGITIGVVGLGLALTSANRRATIALAVVVMLGSAQATAIALINLIDVGRQFGGSGSGASIGIGLWLTLFATQVCGVGGLLGLIGGITTKPAGRPAGTTATDVPRTS